MNRLTTKQLIYINESLAKLVGLESCIADPALLEYIANAPYELRKGGDFYVYRSVVDKATKTMLLLSKERPFKCLNIKTGVVASMTLLETNGIKLDYEQNELSELIDLLTHGSLSFDEIRLWLFRHVDRQISYKLPYNIL